MVLLTTEVVAILNKITPQTFEKLSLMMLELNVHNTAMLDRLIAFLRATLNASRSTLQPLSAEFAHLADYLALMAVRMGPRLTVQLHLPDDLATVQVPPLIENAGMVEVAAASVALNVPLVIVSDGGE